MMSKQLFDIDGVCKIIKTYNGVVSAPPTTEHNETVKPSERQNKTHNNASSFDYLGCQCANHSNSAPGNTTNSLNCTISQKTIKRYHPSQQATEKFNSFCQNLTWESVKPKPNDTASSTFLCKKDEKHCLKGPDVNSVVHSVKTICACSNISMGALTMPCQDKDVWLSLNITMRGKIDNLCEFVRKLNTKLDEVILQNKTESKTTSPKTEINPETSTPKAEITSQTTKIEHKSTSVKTKVQSETISPNNITDTNVTTSTSRSITVTEPLIVDPVPDKDDTAQKYSFGTVLGIALSAFACGTLIAIAAKMSYTRYRRRTYAVNQVRA